MINSDNYGVETNENNNREENYLSDESEDYGHGEPSTFDKTVGHIEDILVDENFHQLQMDFVNKYWHLFEDSEENKLIYTDIFNEYVSAMESYIEKYLKTVIPEFDLEDFLEQIILNRNSLDGEVFEMLLSLSDFITFKELMLDHKAAKEGKTADLFENLLVTPVQMED